MSVPTERASLLGSQRGSVSRAPAQSLLARATRIDVASKATLCNYSNSKNGIVRAELSEHKTPVLNSDSCVIHSTKRHQFQTEDGTSWNGLFHSPDVVGAPGMSFYMPKAAPVADAYFPKQQWGSYTLPANMAHYGASIKVPGQLVSSLPAPTSPTAARSAFQYAKLESLANDPSSNVISPGLGLVVEPEEFQLHVFQNSKPTITEIVPPVPGSVRTDKYHYHSLRQPPVPSYNLSGAFRTAAGTNFFKYK